MPSETTGAVRQARRVARYYRSLDGLAFYRGKRAEGEDAHPVHRAIRDPAGGSASPLVLHRLMLGCATVPPQPRVLDAGCGYGATMLDLAPQLGGDWTGLTLSAAQQARGNAALAARGLAGKARILVQSYDTPPPGPFDLVIGIESLIHSADPNATLFALSRVMAPGGQLVLVDDMPEPRLPPEPASRLAQFRRLWRCPVAPTRAGWVAAMTRAGLTLSIESDLTPLLQSRTLAETAPRRAALDSPIVRLARLLGLGVRAEAEIGGLLLESLLAEGFVRYRLLIARKPHTPAD